MKKTPFLLVFLLCMVTPVLATGQTPGQVGGFVLGKDIAEYAGVVNMPTALPIRYSEYIREVEIKDLAGFKSGLIGYGNCAEPGKILRIKLKYANPSKKFYEKLLKRFKKRFGEPSDWRGDPFHVVLAWKWSFKDQAGNRISLILQHNTRDTEEKVGNAVKLTMTSRIEKERACFEEKHPDFRPHRKKQESKKKMGNKEWEQFVPR